MRALPPVLLGEDLPALLESLAEVVPPPDAALSEEVVAPAVWLLACRAADRAGSAMGAGELRALLERLDGVSPRAGAPHGRVIALEVLEQELVRRAVHLSWREMVSPQIPSLVCTAVLVGVLMVVLRLLAGVMPHAPAWQHLGVLGLVVGTERTPKKK